MRCKVVYANDMACSVIDRRGERISSHKDICAGLGAMRKASPGAKLVSDKGVLLAMRVVAYANLKGQVRKVRAAKRGPVKA